LDIIGGSYFPKHLKLLAPGGRLIEIAHMGGSEVTADLRVVMSKRLLITGSTLRNRPVQEKSSLVSEAGQYLWPLFSSGSLRPTVSRIFPLAQAAEAHRLLESGEHMGKVLLEVS
jgi:NADPH:quinone reductase